MNKILLFCFLVLIIFMGITLHAYGEEIDPATMNSINRVIILPLQNYSKISVYPGSVLLRTQLFNSFFSYLLYIPGMDIPEKNFLLKLNSKDASLIMDKEKPNYLIYGNYMVYGNPMNPKIKITIQALEGNSGETYSNTYYSFTDMEIFDSIDKINQDISSFLLKEKTYIAHLNFRDFKLGGMEYDLLINSKHIAFLTNDNFLFRLDIISGKTNHVELKRLLDSKKVMDKNIVLNPGKSANISYQEKIDYSFDFKGDFSLNGSVNNKVIGTSDYSLHNKEKSAHLMVYCDPESSFTLEPSKSERKALHFSGFCSNYIHLSLLLDHSEASNSSIIRLWFKKMAGNDVYGIFLNDKNSEEYFTSLPLGPSKEKWTKIEAVIRDFEFRTDFQRPEGLINNKIDLPLNEIQFFSDDAIISNTGKFDFYFDSIELIE
jgi:hypothetical protein